MHLANICFLITIEGMLSLQQVRNSRHALTLLEIVVVFAILLMITALAAVSLRSVYYNAANRLAESSVSSAAAAQHSYYNTRNQFALTTNALHSLSQGEMKMLLAPDSSFGPEQVSIASIPHPDFDDGDLIGLAVLSNTGVCVTLLTPAPNYEHIFEPVILEGFEFSCNGALAAEGLA